MSQAVRVGVIGGYRLPGNVRTLLSNLRRILEGAEATFECDLILNEDVDPVDGYQAVDPELGTPGSARSKIVDLSRGLCRYVGDSDPDILFQVTCFPTHGTAAALAGTRTRTRTIVRMAGMSFEEHQFAMDWGERLRLFGLKNCIGLLPAHLADDVVVLGPAARSALARRFRRRRVHEIPQPVDTDTFSSASEHERAELRERLGMPSPDEGRALLTVGRVTRRKGARTIQRTAEHLAEGKDRSVRWYVAGDGPLVGDLKDAPGVEPVGRVPHDRLPDYYRAADLYVHPALHEGLPNVLLEATACGTPSVARDVGECSLAATETFDRDEHLPDLLLREYGRVTLDDQFTVDGLVPAYEKLLVDGES